MPKNYRASTGVTEFYYAVLNESDIATEAPERIEYLQTINVTSEQSPTRAYGDNKTAEIAVSSGSTTVESAFHKLPFEDRQKLLGLETTESGIAAYGSSDNPPYAACVFAKTHEDGSKEWVGLPKGMFLRPGVSGETKADGVTFGTDTITAEFMDREVEGFNDEKSVIFGKDEKDSTAARDEIFTMLFGQPYPDSDTPVGV